MKRFTLALMATTALLCGSAERLPAAFLVSAVVQDPQPKAYLGVSMREADGILSIESVVGGSPADKAGLRAGDRLVSIGGKVTDDLRDLLRVMAALRPGAQVRVKVERGDASRSFQVSLGAFGTEPESSVAVAPATRPTSRQTEERERLQQVSIAKELRDAREVLDRERAAMQSELQQMRRESERSLELAMREVAQTRKQIEHEIRSARQEIEKERARAHREMTQAQEHAEQEIRRVHRQMAEERELLEHEMQRVRREAEEERAGFHAEMVEAHAELDRARQRLSQRSRVKVAPSSRRSGGHLRRVGQRKASLRAQLEQIRQELNALKSRLQQKRH